MKAVTTSATGCTNTGIDQFLEQAVRAILIDVRMRRLCNMGMLVRRLEQAIKAIDNERPATRA